jgi:hypothetical protein
VTEMANIDRLIVERFLGGFLRAVAQSGPNSALADNLRRAAEAMVAAVRESRD